ncbi:hypothetical protein ACLOJK_017833 [Asimina triloba]
MSGRASRTLYVGNLPGDIRESEVEDLFYKYGPIVDIDLKIPPRPPGYAFVEFEDSRDAEDAIRGRDGYNFDGHRLRVELAHGGRGQSSSHDRYSSYSGSGGGRGGVSRRSDYRVLVTGLPSSASWQDLKDHMRRAGDVCFSQVFRDGRGTTGIVDYTNYDDMKYAIRKLDDSEFRNAFSRAYIRVEEYDSRKSLSRSRSRSKSYSRSPFRGRSYSHSRSPSRSSSRSRSRFVILSPFLHSSSLLEWMDWVMDSIDLLFDSNVMVVILVCVVSLSFRVETTLSVKEMFAYTAAAILNDGHAALLIMDHAAIWGLHVRNLMGYGANVELLLVLEISIKIQPPRRRRDSSKSPKKWSPTQRDDSKSPKKCSRSPSYSRSLSRIVDVFGQFAFHNSMQERPRISQGGPSIVWVTRSREVPVYMAISMDIHSHPFS